MPTLADARRFVQDPRTSEPQLRRACQVLGIDTSGEAPALRARLEAHLRSLDESAPVVCLNPRLTAPVSD